MCVRLHVCAWSVRAWVNIGLINKVARVTTNRRSRTQTNRRLVGVFFDFPALRDNDPRRKLISCKHSRINNSVNLVVVRFRNRSALVLIIMR